jgi:hypothetical protein
LVDFVEKVVNDIVEEVVDDIVDDYSDHQCFSSSLGARPVLPMGVDPEAIVESFLSIGSNIFSYSSFQFLYSYDNFIGCATSAADGSSPRGYKGVLTAFYRLKYFLCTTFLL